MSRWVPASTHIAWHMLIREPRRFLTGISAIILATLAVFVCLGFYTGLNDSQARLTTLVRGDLLVFDARTNSVTSFEDIFRSHLSRLLAMDEIVEVVPVHQGAVDIKNPDTEMYKSIQYFAFEPEALPFRLPHLERLAGQLSHPGTMVFDSLSRPHFGRIRTGMDIEVRRTSLRVVGAVRYGPNFSRHGTIFLDTATLKRRLGVYRGPNISLGIVRAKAGVDIPRLQRRIRAVLPRHLLVLTPQELYFREALYVLKLTPAGAILALGLLVAFVVGCVIAYQILYTEITDHMTQFATCKAMGFSPRFLSRLVLQEALFLTVLGFPLGIAATLWTYQYIEGATHTIMELTAPRVAVGFVVTLLMSSVAARMAVQRAIKTDPAELF